MGHCWHNYHLLELGRLARLNCPGNRVWGCECNDDDVFEGIATMLVYTTLTKIYAIFSSLLTVSASPSTFSFVTLGIASGMS
jgi:hypothetical protein